MNNIRKWIYLVIVDACAVVVFVVDVFIVFVVDVIVCNVCVVVFVDVVAPVAEFAVDVLKKFDLQHKYIVLNE